MRLVLLCLLRMERSRASRRLTKSGLTKRRSLMGTMYPRCTCARMAGHNDVNAVRANPNRPRANAMRRLRRLNRL
jgi:hypothetical protein